MRVGGEVSIAGSPFGAKGLGVLEAWPGVAVSTQYRELAGAVRRNGAAPTESELATVPVPLVAAVAYASGGYLFIDGQVTNEYSYGLNFVQVQYKATDSEGVVLADEVGFADARRLGPDEGVTFKGMFALPASVADPVKWSVQAWGVHEGEVMPVLLTPVGSGVRVANGLRYYLRTWQNESSVTVENPILGGWEGDAGRNLLDTLFAYADVQIPPGGSVEFEPVGFRLGVTPSNSSMYCEAMPVDTTVMHTITPSAGANGTISPSTPQTVATGGTLTFTITADSGHHIDDVLVDGTSVGAVKSYTFEDVRADHTIEAMFAGKPKASLSAPRMTRKTLRVKGPRTVITGTIRPAHAKKSHPVIIRFYRYKGGRWVYDGWFKPDLIKTSGGANTWRFYLWMNVPSDVGRYRIRAEHSDSVHAKSYSPYTYFKCVR